MDKVQNLRLQQQDEKNHNNEETISHEFFLQLIDLEEKMFGFEKKQISIQQINALVNKYALCVEYFDKIQNPIVTYFLEKIQITLSTQKFLSILVSSPNREENLLESTSQVKQERKEGIFKISDSNNIVTKTSILQQQDEAFTLAGEKDFIIDLDLRNYNQSPQNINNLFNENNQQSQSNQVISEILLNSTLIEQRTQSNQIYKQPLPQQQKQKLGRHRKQRSSSVDLRYDLNISCDQSFEDLASFKQKDSYIIEEDDLEISRVKEINLLQKKIQRAKKVDMFLQIKHSHIPESLNLEALINDNNSLQQVNDKVIQENLKEQIHNIDERRATKRNQMIRRMTLTNSNK